MIVTGRDHTEASTDPDVIRRWWVRWPHANVAIVTGRRSRLIVLDIDPRNGGEPPKGLPDTVLSQTGGGGEHILFQTDAVIRRKSLSEGVDIKAEGGYIIAPPSKHASGREYVWDVMFHPEDMEPAPLPPGLLDFNGTSTPAPEPDGPIISGRRNDSLTRMAGAMRRQGMDAAAITSALLMTNNRRCQPSLPEEEVRRIGRGITRYRPADPSSRRPTVFVPGTHLKLDATGEIKSFEVDEASFAQEVLERMPKGTFYRRAGQVGELYGRPGDRRFGLVSKERARLVIAENVRFASQKVRDVKRDGPGRPKKDEVKQREVYSVREAVTIDRGALVREEGCTSAQVRDLKRLTTYPVVTGPELAPAAPGWNLGCGTFLDSDEEIRPVPWRLEFFDDLLVDFPFASEADRQNFLGLMLTLVVRPAIDGNVPFHLVEASLERTGKSKLTVDLLGTIFLRRPTPVMQIGNDDAEIEKRITSMMMESRSVACLDNIGRRLDSPSFASLLTAPYWRGRILGKSQTIELANETVFVGSGNNVSASGEIAKRTVPIRLQPKDDHPEERNDFHHPDLRAFARSVRAEALGMLLGMVQEWDKAGRPGVEISMGGFEQWAQMVGGILQFHGYREWLTNRDGWVSRACPERDEIEEFVDVWRKLHGSEGVNALRLVEIAKANALYSWVFERTKTDQGAATLFAKAVMRPLIDRPVGEFLVRFTRSGGVRRFRLETQG